MYSRVCKRNFCFQCTKSCILFRYEIRVSLLPTNKISCAPIKFGLDHPEVEATLLDLHGAIFHVFFFVVITFCWLKYHGELLHGELIDLGISAYSMLGRPDFLRK